MRKRFFVGGVLLAFIAGFAVMSFAAPQLQPPGQKHKITLVNGTIMEGEIVAVTGKTISIRDASLGVIAVARENILKIEPPLDEGTGAAATPPPPPTPAPRYAAQPYAPASNRNGIKIGFSLSGGLGFINGGDFNAYIRDMNAYYTDVNEYYGQDYYTIDWKEMKSMTNFKGEILARFGKNFGVGLGVEFIKKSNPGNLAYDDEYTHKYQYTDYYINYSDYDHETWAFDQTLSVIPITLNLYYYLPICSRGEVYLNVGPGYYMGTLKSNLDYAAEWGYYNDYYWNDGTPWPPDWKSDSQETETDYMDATSNTIGFHFGAGFNFNLTNNISLFGEALYRLANFKKWKGSSGYDYNYQRDYGWWNDNNTWYSHTNVTASDGDDWDGDLWYYDYYNSTFDTEYARYGLYEDKPNENSYTKNVRPAEININGFAFRVGVKIFFGLGGRR